MSRVDEAFEEYRKWREHYPAGCGYHRTDGLASILADEYAKLRSDEPITEDWAALVRSELVALDRDFAETWLVQWSYEIKHNKTYSSMYVTTRGQVRSLLLAAGIECEH